jgi:hypothetical protein
VLTHLPPGEEHHALDAQELAHRAPGRQLIPACVEELQKAVQRPQLREVAEHCEETGKRECMKKEEGRRKNEEWKKNEGWRMKDEGWRMKKGRRRKKEEKWKKEEWRRKKEEGQRRRKKDKEERKRLLPEM